MPASPGAEIGGFLRMVAAVPQSEIDAIVALGRRALLEKGEFLARPGEVEHRLAFLHTGIVRYHVIVEATGEDVTKDFSFAPSFAVSFGSAVQGKPARVAVSAVVDCAVTLWPFAAFRQRLGQHAAWQEFGRVVAERLYVRKEDREIALLTMDAEARYRAMLAEFPDARRIPHGYGDAPCGRRREV